MLLFVFACYLISSEWMEFRNHGWDLLFFMWSRKPHFHVENGVHVHSSTKTGRKEPRWKRASLSWGGEDRMPRASVLSGMEARGWFPKPPARWRCWLVHSPKVVQAPSLWAEHWWDSLMRALGWGLPITNLVPFSASPLYGQKSEHRICFQNLWSHL